MLLQDKCKRHLHALADRLAVEERSAPKLEIATVTGPVRRSRVWVVQRVRKFAILIGKR